jgi:hypothetical protein
MELSSKLSKQVQKDCIIIWATLKDQISALPESPLYPSNKSLSDNQPLNRVTWH